MMEKTLVLIKPDGVQRALTGRIIQRFEDAGLKIIGMRMVQVTPDLAEKHYTEDITVRRGKHVRDMLLGYVQEGPVLAIALEGIHAIELVRKLVGPTEPKSAAPGTIRGDFSHHSYIYCDEKKIPIKNLIHASGDKADAEREVALWFGPKDLMTYQTVHEKHTF